MEIYNESADISALVRWVWEPTVLEWTTRALGNKPLAFTFAEADRLRALNTNNTWFDPTQIGHRACLYFDYTASCLHLLRLFKQLHDNINSASPNYKILDEHLLGTDGIRWSDGKDLSVPANVPTSPPLNPPGAVDLCALEMERMKCEPLAIIRCLEYGLSRCVALNARMQTLTNGGESQFAIARGYWTNAFVPGLPVTHSLEVCAQTPLAYAQPIQADMAVGPKVHNGFGGPIAMFLNRVTEKGEPALDLSIPLVEGEAVEDAPKKAAAKKTTVTAATAAAAAAAAAKKIPAAVAKRTVPAATAKKTVPAVIAKKLVKRPNVAPTTVATPPASTRAVTPTAGTKVATAQAVALQKTAALAKAKQDKIAAQAEAHRRQKKAHDAAETQRKQTVAQQANEAKRKAELALAGSRGARQKLVDTHKAQKAKEAQDTEAAQQKADEAAINAAAAQQTAADAEAARLKAAADEEEARQQAFLRQRQLADAIKRQDEEAYLLAQQNQMVNGEIEAGPRLQTSVDDYKVVEEVKGELVKGKTYTPLEIVGLMAGNTHADEILRIIGQHQTDQAALAKEKEEIDARVLASAIHAGNYTIALESAHGDPAKMSQITQLINADAAEQDEKDKQLVIDEITSGTLTTEREAQIRREYTRGISLLNPLYHHGIADALATYIQKREERKTVGAAVGEIAVHVGIATGRAGSRRNERLHTKRSQSVIGRRAKGIVNAVSATAANVKGKARGALKVAASAIGSTATALGAAAASAAEAVGNLMGSSKDEKDPIPPNPTPILSDTQKIELANELDQVIINAAATPPGPSAQEPLPKSDGSAASTLPDTETAEVTVSVDEPVDPLATLKAGIENARNAKLDGHGALAMVDTVITDLTSLNGNFNVDSDAFVEIWNYAHGVILKTLPFVNDAGKPRVVQMTELLIEAINKSPSIATSPDQQAVNTELRNRVTAADKEADGEAEDATAVPVEAAGNQDAVSAPADEAPGDVKESRDDAGQEKEEIRAALETIDADTPQKEASDAVERALYFMRGNGDHTLAYQASYAITGLEKGPEKSKLTRALYDLLSQYDSDHFRTERNMLWLEINDKAANQPADKPLDKEANDRLSQIGAEGLQRIQDDDIQNARDMLLREQKLIAANPDAVDEFMSELANAVIDIDDDEQIQWLYDFLGTLQSTKAVRATRSQLYSSNDAIVDTTMPSAGKAANAAESGEVKSTQPAESAVAGGTGLEQHELDELDAMPDSDQAAGTAASGTGADTAASRNMSDKPKANVTQYALDEMPDSGKIDQADLNEFNDDVDPTIASALAKYKGEVNEETGNVFTDDELMQITRAKQHANTLVEIEKLIESHNADRKQKKARAEKQAREEAERQKAAEKSAKEREPEQKMEEEKKQAAAKRKARVDSLGRRANELKTISDEDLANAEAEKFSSVVESGDNSVSVAEDVFKRKVQAERARRVQVANKAIITQLKPGLRITTIENARKRIADAQKVLDSNQDSEVVAAARAVIDSAKIFVKTQTDATKKRDDAAEQVKKVEERASALAINVAAFNVGPGDAATVFQKLKEFRTQQRILHDDVETERRRQADGPELRIGKHVNELNIAAKAAYDTLKRIEKAFVDIVPSAIETIMAKSKPSDEDVEFLRKLVEDPTTENAAANELVKMETQHAADTTLTKTNAALRVIEDMNWRIRNPTGYEEDAKTVKTNLAAARAILDNLNSLSPETVRTKNAEVTQLRTLLDRVGAVDSRRKQDDASLDELREKAKRLDTRSDDEVRRSAIRVVGVLQQRLGELDERLANANQFYTSDHEAMRKIVEEWKGLKAKQIKSEEESKRFQALDRIVTDADGREGLQTEREITHRKLSEHEQALFSMSPDVAERERAFRERVKTDSSLVDKYMEAVVPALKALEADAPIDELKYNEELQQITETLQAFKEEKSVKTVFDAATELLNLRRTQVAALQSVYQAVAANNVLRIHMERIEYLINADRTAPTVPMSRAAIQRLGEILVDAKEAHKSWLNPTRLENMKRAVLKTGAAAAVVGGVATALAYPDAAKGFAQLALDLVSGNVKADDGDIAKMIARGDRAARSSTGGTTYTRSFSAPLTTIRGVQSIEHVDRAQLLLALATLPATNPLHWCGNLSWAFIQSGLAYKCRGRYMILCKLWSERRNKQIAS